MLAKWSGIVLQGGQTSLLREQSTVTSLSLATWQGSPPHLTLWAKLTRLLRQLSWLMPVIHIY